MSQPHSPLRWCEPLAVRLWYPSLQACEWSPSAPGSMPLVAFWWGGHKLWHLGIHSFSQYEVFFYSRWINLPSDILTSTEESNPVMSRRKVRGLTRTGRQVSEDPDLDNLLSTLSPEEMEELDKDLMSVPDINPEDGKIIIQGDTTTRSDTKARLSQREPSLEVSEETPMKFCGVLKVCFRDTWR